MHINVGSEHCARFQLITALLLFPVCAWAQVQPASLPGSSNQPQDMRQMPMPTGKMDDNVMKNMQPQTFLQEIEHHSGGGTSAQPTSTPFPMLMGMKGQWEFMFHANVFISDLQQSGPRGADRFFSTNWFMGMAQHHAGPGTFTARLMLSPAPRTSNGPPVSLALPARRNRFWSPHCGRAASARLLHGVGGALRFEGGREKPAVILFCTH